VFEQRSFGVLLSRHTPALFLTLWALLCLAQAQQPDAAAANATVVPGKRVGSIGKFTTASMLESIYGLAHVQHKKLPMPSGELYDASIIGEGTALELEVVWDPEAVHERVASVELVGKGWALSNGLKLGLSPAAVQKINGKSFMLSGFGWDYGGYATIKEGTLAEGLSLRFAPLEKDYPDSLRGDLQVSSESDALATAQAVLVEINVEFK
jgi:hypothetical protein